MDLSSRFAWRRKPNESGRDKCYLCDILRYVSIALGITYWTLVAVIAIYAFVATARPKSLWPLYPLSAIHQTVVGIFLLIASPIGCIAEAKSNANVEMFRTVQYHTGCGVYYLLMAGFVLVPFTLPKDLIDENSQEQKAIQIFYYVVSVFGVVVGIFKCILTGDYYVKDEPTKTETSPLRHDEVGLDFWLRKAEAQQHTPNPPPTLFTSPKAPPMSPQSQHLKSTLSIHAKAPTAYEKAIEVSHGGASSFEAVSHGGANPEAVSHGGANPFEAVSHGGANPFDVDVMAEQGWKGSSSYTDKKKREHSSRNSPSYKSRKTSDTGISFPVASPTKTDEKNPFAAVTEKTSLKSWDEISPQSVKPRRTKESSATHISSASVKTQNPQATYASMVDHSAPANIFTSIREDQSSLVDSAPNRDQSSLVDSGPNRDQSSLVDSGPNRDQSSLVDSAPNRDQSSLVDSGPNPFAAVDDDMKNPFTTDVMLEKKLFDP